MTEQYYKTMLKDRKEPMKYALLQYVIIIVSVLLARPDTWYKFAGLVAILSLTISTLIAVLNKTKIYMKKTLVSFGKTFIIMSILYIATIYFKGWGVLGLIITVVGIAAWKMYQQRDFVSEAKANIEVLMFGQPQTLKMRKKMGYKGTFKEYWRNRK